MKVLRRLLYCMILSLFFPLIGHAEEIVPEREQLDIIFVIDSSGSMKTNDPSGIGLDMVQAFIDTMQTKGIRIGYVAYNHEILSYLAPETIDTTGKRENLKDRIASITYSGDTDIGMGVSHAYKLLDTESDTHKIMVLISDGETDLPAGSSRTEEQSGQELEYCVGQCREKNIPIYTIAFGQYDGNTAFLEKISSETNAEGYSAKNPEDLIEILYGIFQDNLFYQMQQFSNGTYAGGRQQITCVLDSAYWDETDILLISSGTVGETVVRYEGTELLLTNLSHYAVGKIEDKNNSVPAKKLIIETATDEGQDLQVYVISYRGLIPVLNIETEAEKNEKLEYGICFKKTNGTYVTDAGFYKLFSWELSTVPDTAGQNIETDKTEVLDEMIKGSIRFTHSGRYTLQGTLSDEYGSYVFPISIEVTNTIPSGSIPEKTVLMKQEQVHHLNDYFNDVNGDELSYSIPEGQEEEVLIQLDGDELTLIPQSTGRHLVTIQISDGEDAIQYTYRLEVRAWWQVYWWVILIALAVLAAIAAKILYKPKPELERITEKKKQYHFSGKLNAYFLQQPQDNEEIPPLYFQMNRVKDGRVSLGDLFGDYPEQIEALQLNSIFLIADENHSMILYHTSKSAVIVGNSIACRQIQYSIHFGDVIFITSPDGDYDLEIHYVAVFQ